MSNIDIQLSDVHIAINQQWIVRDLTFSIRSGEFIGVIGPNGAGKTTVMNAILGFVSPTRGSVQVFGAPMARTRRAEMGYVPQTRPLASTLSLSVQDFVTLGLRPSLRPWLRSTEREAVEEALVLSGSFPWRDQSVKNLSGGERQRVYLAQALVRKPRCLLLDEPTASLDPGAVEMVVALVAHIQREQGTTVVMISHDVNAIAPVADRVLYMAKGRHAIGTVDEVVQPNVLSQLYGASVDVVRHAGKAIVLIGAQDRPDDATVLRDGFVMEEAETTVLL